MSNDYTPLRPDVLDALAQTGRAYSVNEVQHCARELKALRAQQTNGQVVGYVYVYEALDGPQQGWSYFEPGPKLPTTAPSAVGPGTYYKVVKQP